jgi:hypothetical protein
MQAATCVVPHHLPVLAPISCYVLCCHALPCLTPSAWRLQVNISEGAGMASRLSTTTYYTLIKLLATAASGSHTIAETLLQAGTSEVLRTLLANSSMLSTSTTPASILKSTDQLYEVVNLAHELLPPLTDAARAVQQDMPLASGAARGSAGGAGTSASAAAAEEQCLRAQFMSQNPEILQKFSQDLLPLLVQVGGCAREPELPACHDGAM